MSRSIIITASVTISIIFTSCLNDFANKTKDSPHEVVTESKPDPCSLPFKHDTVFNGIAIGTKRSNYSFKNESVKFTTDQSLKGIIKWKPTWDRDSLVAIELTCIADKVLENQGYELTSTSNQLLALHVWGEILKRWSRDADYTNDEYQSTLDCGRFSFQLYNKSFTIYIFDNCYEKRKKATEKLKEISDRVESEKLFK